jgi:ABC-type transport system involved in cytochrome bd biosynthesis fused ATPase/permease subunit
VQHRRGRTTLLTSTSVIALQGADEVHLLVDGRVVATAAHAAFIVDHPAYDALIRSGEALSPLTADDEVPSAPS